MKAPLAVLDAIDGARRVVAGCDFLAHHLGIRAKLLVSEPHEVLFRQM